MMILSINVADKIAGSDDAWSFRMVRRKGVIFQEGMRFSMSEEYQHDYGFRISCGGVKRLRLSVGMLLHIVHVAFIALYHYAMVCRSSLRRTSILSNSYMMRDQPSSQFFCFRELHNSNSILMPNLISSIQISICVRS